MGNNNNSVQLFMALLGGAAFGASAAVLFAPESGKVTRRKIKRAASRVSNNLASTAEALSKTAQQNIDESGNDLGYQIGAAIARTVITVEQISEILKSKLEELKSGNEAIIVDNHSSSPSKRDRAKILKRIGQSSET